MKRGCTRTLFTLRLLLLHAALWNGATGESTAAWDHNSPLPLNGLVSFWDFQEVKGPFVAKLGSSPYKLHGQTFDHDRRVFRPVDVERVNDAPPGRPFGPRSASIDSGQFLVVPNTSTAAPFLDIHGDNATLSLVVWARADMRFERGKATSGSLNFGHLAGIWSEPLGARRYVIFGRAPRGHPINGSSHLDVEVSRTGINSPPCRWSISYAVGSAHVRYGDWNMLALTFDGSAIRSYVNGTLDTRSPHRLHPASDPCNETWANPASIDIWTNRSRWGPGGDPRTRNQTDFAVGGQKGKPGSGIGHPWTGRVGGLAVYSRALTASELQAMAKKLPAPDPTTQ